MQSLISLAKQATMKRSQLLATRALLPVSRRFEGSYPWYQSMAENIPKKNPRVADETLDETEVITRIMHVLHKFRIYDLQTLDWTKPFNAQGIDSLETTAILTTIEDEFHTIFEDRVFENFENLDQVKQHLVLDHNAF